MNIDYEVEKIFPSESEHDITFIKKALQIIPQLVHKNEFNETHLLENNKAFVNFLQTIDMDEQLDGVKPGESTISTLDMVTLVTFPWMLYVISTDIKSDYNNMTLWLYKYYENFCTKQVNSIIFNTVIMRDKWNFRLVCQLLCNSLHNMLETSNFENFIKYSLSIVDRFSEEQWIIWRKEMRRGKKTPFELYASQLKTMMSDANKKCIHITDVMRSINIIKKSPKLSLFCKDSTIVNALTNIECTLEEYTTFINELNEKLNRILN